MAMAIDIDTEIWIGSHFDEFNPSFQMCRKNVEMIAWPLLCTLQYLFMGGLGNPLEPGNYSYWE